MTTASPPSEGSVVDLVCPSVAALLCALVCALGLNSAIRYVVRCGYSFGLWTSEQIPALDELPSTSTGLTKSALSQIPATAYESGLNLTVTDCSICLGDFAEGEKVRLVPKCSHVFHAVYRHMAVVKLLLSIVPASIDIFSTRCWNFIVGLPESCGQGNLTYLGS